MWPFKRQPPPPPPKPKPWFRIRPEETSKYWVVEERSRYTGDWYYRKLCDTQEEATQVAMEAEEKRQRDEVYYI